MALDTYQDALSHALVIRRGIMSFSKDEKGNQDTEGIEAFIKYLNEVQYTNSSDTQSAQRMNNIVEKVRVINMRSEEGFEEATPQLEELFKEADSLYHTMALSAAPKKEKGQIASSELSLPCEADESCVC